MIWYSSMYTIRYTWNEYCRIFRLVCNANITGNMLNMHYPLYVQPDTTPLRSMHGLSSIQPFPSVDQPATLLRHAEFTLNVQPYHNQNPFILQFQHGNIRKCIVCGGKIVKKSDKGWTVRFLRGGGGVGQIPKKIRAELEPRKKYLAQENCMKKKSYKVQKHRHGFRTILLVS